MFCAKTNKLKQEKKKITAPVNRKQAQKLFSSLGFVFSSVSSLLSMQIQMFTCMMQQRKQQIEQLETALFEKRLARKRYKSKIKS